MENLVSKVCALFQKEKICFLLLPFSFITVFCFILSGCASSDVSRDTAANVHASVQGTKNFVNGVVDSSISESYQNTNQTTKGAIVGGTAGGAAGALTSGVGFFPGVASGAVFGAIYGGYIDSRSTRQDRLINRGANVIVLGDQILIVLPSARLFDEYTATIKPQAYSTLNLVAQYISGYTKMLVKISAYTDDSGSKRGDLSLSKQQAEKVARILLASGVNARVLYAQGYGSSNLVEKSTMDWDSDNYRIEITLEKLYV